MKYCTHCGKELFDEAVICPNCKCNVSETVAVQKKTKKPINKKKLVLVSILILAVIIVAVGGYFGVILLKNNALATDLENQLAGKTFEYKFATDDYEIFQVCWISFDENGRYSLEQADTLYYMELDTEEGDYSVKVDFEGKCELLVGSSTFKIDVNEDSEIESITNDDMKYYPFDTVKGDSLAVQIQKEQDKHTLQVNQEQALNYFATRIELEFGETFENLTSLVFKEYDLTCEPEANSINVFIITLSGEYYLNKFELPNLTHKGELKCKYTVGTESDEFRVLSDDGILDSMNLHVVLNKYSYYSW